MRTLSDELCSSHLGGCGADWGFRGGNGELTGGGGVSFFDKLDRLQRIKRQGSAQLSGREMSLILSMLTIVDRSGASRKRARLMVVARPKVEARASPRQTPIGTASHVP